MRVIRRWRASFGGRGQVPAAVDAASLGFSAVAGWPFLSATFHAALEGCKRYQGRRHEEAWRVVARELRAANMTVDEAVRRDGTAAMLFMLLRAATEGAARTNLRILAKALAGYDPRRDR